MEENCSDREPGVAEAPPHYHGHHERLRTRFRKAGSDAVCDYELLELVLFRALPRRDVKPLAKSLIAEVRIVRRSDCAAMAGGLPRLMGWAMQPSKAEP